MTSSTNRTEAEAALPARSRRCVVVALTLGAVTALISGFVLAAWFVGASRWTYLVPGWATMKPNTAFSFLLLGVCWSFRAAGVMAPARVPGWLPVPFAVGAMSVGLLTLAEHAGLKLPGFDEMLATAPRTVYPPGRMSPVTASMIAVLGYTGLFGAHRVGARVLIPLTLALTAAVAVLSGYLFDAKLLYLSRGFETVAFATACCAMFISVGGFLMRPASAPLRLLLADSLAGTAMRTGLPLAVSLLIVINLLLAWLYRRDVITVPVGIGLGLMTNVMAVVGAFLFTGRAIEVLERRAAVSASRLVDSEARFRLVTDNAPVMLWMCDDAARLILSNRGWNDFVGARAEGNPGRDWDDSIHPGDRAGFRRAVERALRDRGGFEGEFRMRRHDGDIRWMLVSAVSGPVGHDGRDGLIGSCVDITESKRAGERGALLMRELDHRVKNSLAAVASLADMTFAATRDSESFRAAFQGRLMAMARAHSALAAGRWTGLGLETLIRTVLEPLLDIENHAVTLHGGPAYIPQQAVSPLSMALHELATNAQKHGALSRDGGTIRIEWAVKENDRGHSMISIQWVEQGGPPVPNGVVPHAGLGTSLVRGLVEAELGGTFEMRFEPSGLRAVVVFDTGLWASATAADGASTLSDQTSPRQEAVA